MEENLDINNKSNKEISDNTTQNNSEEIKEPKSEKISIWIQIMTILKVIMLLKLLKKMKLILPPNLSQNPKKNFQ